MVPPPNRAAAVGSFVEIDITADSAGHASWQQPVRPSAARAADDARSALESAFKGLTPGAGRRTRRCRTTKTAASIFLASRHG
jgi:hypothetical protein